MWITANSHKVFSRFKKKQKKKKRRKKKKTKTKKTNKQTNKTSKQTKGIAMSTTNDEHKGQTIMRTLLTQNPDNRLTDSPVNSHAKQTTKPVAHVTHTLLLAVESQTSHQDPAQRKRRCE
jgi:hypothetical protein